MKNIFLVISTTVIIILLGAIAVIGLPLKKSLAAYQQQLQELQEEYQIQLKQSDQLAVEDATYQQELLRIIS